MPQSAPHLQAPCISFELATPRKSCAASDRRSPSHFRISVQLKASTGRCLRCKAALASVDTANLPLHARLATLARLLSKHRFPQNALQYDDGDHGPAPLQSNTIRGVRCFQLHIVSGCGGCAPQCGALHAGGVQLVASHCFPRFAMYSLIFQLAQAQQLQSAGHKAATSTHCTRTAGHLHTAWGSVPVRTRTLRLASDSTAIASAQRELVLQLQASEALGAKAVQTLGYVERQGESMTLMFEECTGTLQELLGGGKLPLADVVRASKSLLIHFSFPVLCLPGGMVRDFVCLHRPSRLFELHAQEWLAASTHIAQFTGLQHAYRRGCPFNNL